MRLVLAGITLRLFSKSMWNKLVQPSRTTSLSENCHSELVSESYLLNLNDNENLKRVQVDKRRVCREKSSP